MPRRLRILHFANSFWLGGTEVQLAGLIKGLHGRHDQSVAAIENDGPLLQHLWELKIPVSEYSLGGVFRVKTAMQILRLARQLRQERVELVHAHSLYAALVAYPAARLAGAKFVFSRLDQGHWLGPLKWKATAFLSRHADHVVANAQAVADVVVGREGARPEQVTVIPNGLDLAAFDARVKEGLCLEVPDVGDAPVVLHVANMQQEVKRHEDLLYALALAKLEVPRLQAFLVGDGERRAGLEQLASALGIQDAVHFLSWRIDVPALYARATLGVLCSNAEGMSNAVMEGMAAQRPMVVTNVGGNPELIAHGERGLVVEPHRPADLARAMVQILRSPREAQRMGQNARRHIRDALSVQHLADRHDALYRHLVERGSKNFLTTADSPRLSTG